MKLEMCKWSRCLLLALIAQASLWGVTPVSHLAEQADLVVLGDVASMEVLEGGGVEVRLQPRLVLKGVMPAGPVMASLDPSGLMAQHQERSLKGMKGRSGLWFLRQTSSGGYAVLPPQASDYTEEDAFVAVPASWIPPSGAGLELQLLAAVRHAYEAKAEPSAIDEGLLIMSLEAANRGNALTVAEGLMGSPTSTADRALGVAVAIRLGSDAALNRLASDLNSLRLEKEFDRIVFAIHNLFSPSGAQSMAALRRLVEQRSGAPGLDAAVGKALQRAQSKEALPVLALLLGSPDPEAKRTAAWAFHSFAALAGPDGSVNRSGDGRHPFQTEATTRFSGWDQTISAAEHAAFWESWWSEHRAQFGFAE